MSEGSNVRQAVPFFRVASIDASLRFYIDLLGFTMKNRWIDEGKLRWCWLELGEAALMLQEFRTPPASKLGEGVSICFICNDALAIYRDVKAKGIESQRPFVGNNMWVVTLIDPDGYVLEFESMTDAPEESLYSD